MHRQQIVFSCFQIYTLHNQAGHMCLPVSYFDCGQTVEHLYLIHSELQKLFQAVSYIIIICKISSSMHVQPVPLLHIAESILLRYSNNYAMKISLIKAVAILHSTKWLHHYSATATCMYWKIYNTIVYTIWHTIYSW